MGFWSGLGTIAGLGLAPFTGGASLALGPALGGIGDALSGGQQALTNVGQVAGNDAAAAASGRAQQGQIQQGQDRNAIGLYDAKLKAAQQALNQNSQLAGQTARGDLLSNVQDVNISGLPSGVHMANMTGGLRPSVLGPNARQAGSTLSRNALLQLMAGPTNLPTAPSLTPLPDASAYDSLTKNLGRAGSYAGALSPLFSGGGGGNSNLSSPQPGGALMGGGQQPPQFAGWAPQPPQTPDQIDWSKLPGYGTGAN